MCNSTNDVDATIASFDAAWFSRHLNEDIVSVHWGEAISTGFISGVKKVRLVTNSGESHNLILKIYREGSGADRNAVLTLGCAREADFYNFLSKVSSERHAALDAVVPRVFFAESDWTTGNKCILMSDLTAGNSGVPSTYFFGPGSPLNWNQDLAKLTASFPGLMPEEIAKVSFSALARIHAQFWGHKELLEIPWLSGSQWLKGEGKDSWEAIMKLSKDAFERLKAKVENGLCPHPIGSILYRCIVTVFEQLKWEDFCKECHSLKWTLVHGDFHAGNIIWMPDDHINGVRFLDWEFVGVGSGPQELGMYIICHLDVREYGKKTHVNLVKHYYEELTRVNPRIESEFSFDLCWRDFVYGGFKRWLWTLPVISYWSPSSLPFFVQQVEGFRKMHGILENKVGLPRWI